MTAVGVAPAGVVAGRARLDGADRHYLVAARALLDGYRRHDGSTAITDLLSGLTTDLLGGRNMSIFTVCGATPDGLLDSLLRLADVSPGLAFDDALGWVSLMYQAVPLTTPNASSLPKDWAMIGHARDGWLWQAAGYTPRQVRALDVTNPFTPDMAPILRRRAARDGKLLPHPVPVRQGPGSPAGGHPRHGGPGAPGETSMDRLADAITKHRFELSDRGWYAFEREVSAPPGPGHAPFTVSTGHRAVFRDRFGTDLSALLALVEYVRHRPGPVMALPDFTGWLFATGGHDSPFGMARWTAAAIEEWGTTGHDHDGWLWWSAGYTLTEVEALSTAGAPVPSREELVATAALRGVTIPDMLCPDGQR